MGVSVAVDPDQEVAAAAPHQIIGQGADGLTKSIAVSGLALELQGRAFDPAEGRREILCRGCHHAGSGCWHHDFFTELGLTVIGRDTVLGDWTDTAVGLDGNHATIAMLRTPDGHGCLELFEYLHPDAIKTPPTRPNEIGIHRVAFSVDDLDAALEIAARHGAARCAAWPPTRTCTGSGMSAAPAASW